MLDVQRLDFCLGLANVVLNQPPVNSLSEEFLDNISSTFKKIELDNSIRGVILSSAFHGKVFSAGLNIPELCNRWVENSPGITFKFTTMNAKLPFSFYVCMFYSIRICMSIAKA